MASKLSYKDFSALHKAMYAGTQLFLRADRPEVWKGEWKDQYVIGSGFYYQLTDSVTLLVTCKHIIDDRASFLPEAALAAVPIEEWTLETFARTLQAKVKESKLLPSSTTLVLQAEQFRGLDGENLTAVPVQINDHKVLALTPDMLPTPAQLTQILSPCERVHHLTFPWPVAATAVGAGAGASDSSKIVSPNLDSRLPIFSNGELAFPPSLDFRGRAKGVFNPQGRLDTSTGGAPLFFSTAMYKNWVLNQTMLSGIFLLLGIHSEGPEERELLDNMSVNNGSAGSTSNLSFYLKAELLNRFCELFSDLY